MQWSHREPVRWATSGEVARALDLAPHQAKHVQLSGLAGPVVALGESGTRYASPVSKLAQLRERRMLDSNADDLPPAVVVKVTSPQSVDEPDRRYVGWSIDMPDDVAEAATSRWWPVPAIPEGTLLVVSLATIVVRVRRIVGAPRTQGRAAFSTVAAEHTIYDNARIKTRPGPVVDLIALDR